MFGLRQPQLPLLQGKRDSPSADTISLFQRQALLGMELIQLAITRLANRFCPEVRNSAGLNDKEGCSSCAETGILA